jgi:hypothetical protein
LSCVFCPDNRQLTTKLPGAVFHVIIEFLAAHGQVLFGFGPFNKVLFDGLGPLGVDLPGSIFPFLQAANAKLIPQGDKFGLDPVSIICWI